jgi:hypothetical protein
MGVGYERFGWQAQTAGDDRRFHDPTEADGEHGINADAAGKNGYPAAIPLSRPTNTQHYATWDGSAPIVSRQSRSLGSILRSLAVLVFQLLRRSRRMMRVERYVPTVPDQNRTWRNLSGLRVT